MSRKIIHDTETDGTTPISFIIGTISQYRFKTGTQKCSCHPATRRYGLGCFTCKPHKVAAQVEAAMKDERVARTMAHAAHESVRASLGLATSTPRDARTAIWSARLQGVGSETLAHLPGVSHA
jgi:hypothetical protein